MLFTSVVFLIWFLPLFIVVYHLLDRRYRNPYILLSSIFFYAWGAPVFIFLLLGTTFADFHLVKWMHRAGEEGNLRRKKQFLLLSLSLNLGMLAYFKYANFFADTLNELLLAIGMEPFVWTHVVLPLGISFFTFECITYLVDVYRGEMKPLRSFADYQLYILFFPKLLAGPIVRYAEIGDQIRERSAHENPDAFITGFLRVMMGLFKMLVIANPIGALVQPLFESDPQQLNAGLVVLALMGFAFQLYFDFSAYSDIALGIARMIGFRLAENFNHPFHARSITEFWRRWHISLGKWFRNYLYIPLGGNRGSNAQSIRNLWIIFLVCGFWHAAHWTTMVWAFIHGLCMTVERGAFGKWLNASPAVWGRIYTFSVICLSFIFVQFESVGKAFSFLGGAFHSGVQEISLPLYALYALVFAVAMVLFGFTKAGSRACDFIYAETRTDYSAIAATVISLLLLFVVWVAVASAPYSPFYYFRF